MKEKETSGLFSKTNSNFQIQQKAIMGDWEVAISGGMTEKGITE